MNKCCPASSVGSLVLVVTALVGLIFGLPILRADFVLGLVPAASSAALLVLALLSIQTPVEQEKPVRRWTAPIVMICLVLYLLALTTIGFMIDTSLLVIVSLLAAGVRRLGTIALTLAALLAISLIFQELLGVHLPRGVL